MKITPVFFVICVHCFVIYNAGNLLVIGVIKMNAFPFSPDDQAALSRHGIPEAAAVTQLEQMRHGGDRARPLNAVTERSGYLLVKSLADLDRVGEGYDEVERSKPSAFFIPAAGAASRMFKLLKKTVEMGESSLADNERDTTDRLLDAVAQDRMAFTDELREKAAATGFDLAGVLARRDKPALFAYILDVLEYKDRPKAVIPIHRYGPGDVRTPLEEHLRFCRDLMPRVRIHLAVSEEHHRLIEETVAGILEKTRAGESGFAPEITYSYQDPSTDAVAYDVDRDAPQHHPETGELVMRKAGHGALLKNMSDIPDVHGVWLRNIDNLVREDLNGTLLITKKAMRMLAHRHEERLFELLGRLDDITGEVYGPLIEEIADFCGQELCCRFDPAVINAMSDPAGYLRFLLDRPVAVVAYIPLPEGAKGGGGFVIPKTWTHGPDSLTVEKASTFEGQELEGGLESNPLAREATHFHPTDIYLTKKDRHGQLFDFSRFRDPERAMVDDKDLFPGVRSRIWEHPGLWNGSIADVFHVSLHLPQETFSPIKSFHNLLDENHAAT